MVGLFNVLQLVGGEEKPPMGYIYEDMDRVTLPKPQKKMEENLKTFKIAPEFLNSNSNIDQDE